MQVGDIFYGVDWFATNKPVEVYQITHIEYYSNYYDVSIEVIIGGTGKFTFPNNWNANELLTSFYSDESIWIYSKNIEALVNLNEKILNGQSTVEDISLRAWDIWNHKWIKLYAGDL